MLKKCSLFNTSLTLPNKTELQIRTVIKRNDSTTYISVTKEHPNRYTVFLKIYERIPQITRHMRSPGVTWQCVSTRRFWCTFKCESPCSRPFCASEMTSLPFDLFSILQVLAQMLTLPGSFLASSPRRTHRLHLPNPHFYVRHLQSVPLY